ncbi:MAG: ABC transporter ATP-binding protein [Oscillochloris sp.]|nr:ABC transporter ATP-binding protein [Oscillochloris sp.]
MIVLDKLNVHYGAFQAVSDLSLNVHGGEVFGMLGPNGAGKSSTLGCIEGLVTASSGSVRVAGYDMRREPIAAKALLGVQLQRAALFAELTLRELVEFYAALYNRFPARAEVTALLARFGLAQKVNARPRRLSGGQQQRLSLALALVNNPQVVLFDEPTSALDPQARRAVWATIRRMRDEGRTVLITTHSMDEAEELCDRVAIVDTGRLVALGTPAELIARHAPPLSLSEAARRNPNLEDVFLAITGRSLTTPDSAPDAESAWLAGTV